MIDPSIALSYKPAETPDPIASQARIEQLRGMQQERQVRAQQMQMGQLQLQQQQLELQDQQTMRQAFGQSGGDLDKMTQLVAGRVSPKAMMALRQSALEQREKLAGIGEKELKIGQGHAEAIANVAEGILNAPEEQRPAMYAQGIARLVQGGHIAPKDADFTYPGEEWLRVHANSKNILEAEMKRREVAAQETSAQARADQAQVQADKAKAEMPGLIAGSDLKQLEAKGQAPIQPYQQAELTRQQAQAAETTRYHQAEIGIRNSDLALNRQKFNATLGAGLDANGQPKVGADGKPLTGDAYLATLPPATAAAVKAYAEGRTTKLPRGKELWAIQGMVSQYDPTFSEQRAQLRKSFTTGKAGDNIGALNTATVHLDQLSEAAKAMSNGSFRPGNKIWNDVITMFGGSAPTNFEGLKSAVAGEMANALKGNATDVEIANISKSIMGASAPGQLAGVVDTHLHTLGAKLNTYDERYHQQMPNDQWSPVLPAAQAAFQKHGVSPIARQQQGGNSGNQAPAYQVGQSVMYNGAPHKVKAIKPDGKLVLEQ